MNAYVVTTEHNRRNVLSIETQFGEILIVYILFMMIYFVEVNEIHTQF